MTNTIEGICPAPVSLRESLFLKTTKGVCLMYITKDVVLNAAFLSRIKLDEKETEEMQKQIEINTTPSSSEVFKQPKSLKPHHK